jgi:hypothetical protein
VSIDEVVLGPAPTPGFYFFRARRGAPRQPVRIMNDGGYWTVILRGEPAVGSGAEDWIDVPLLLFRWPFTPISEAEYYALLQEYERAGSGHPLADPESPVDLRRAPSLF